MRAGSLREIITVQSQTITKDSFGSNNTVWGNKFTTRAQITTNSGNREVQNNEIVNTYTLTFTIRYYHEVEEANRILYNGKKYRILSVNKELVKQSVSIIGELINE